MQPLLNGDVVSACRRILADFAVMFCVAKRSALDETHGPDWPLPRYLRHGWELHGLQYYQHQRFVKKQVR